MPELAPSRLGLLLALPATLALQEPARRQIGQMVLEDVPPVEEPLRARMRPYLETRSAELADLRADGQALLISTRFGATSQLHVVSAPLGMRRQVTFFDEPVSGGLFVPGGSPPRIVYAKDDGGNENYQLHLLDLSSGRSTLLTDGRSRHDSYVVDRAGRLLSFNGNARDPGDMDLYVRDLTKDEPARRIWEVDGDFAPVEFSPDGGKLLVRQFLSESETRLHLLDVASGRHAPLTNPEPPRFYGNVSWSADGESIFLTSDRDGEFNRLYRVSLDGSRWTCLTDDLAWDVEVVAVEPNGKGLALVLNEEGVSRLLLTDDRGGNRRPVPALPPGRIASLAVSRSGGVVALALDSAAAPTDVYSVDFARGDVTRWTASEGGGLDADAFVRPTLVHYPTFDEVGGERRRIPAFYYKARPPGRRPVVVWVHGGPESQYRPYFSGVLQFWAVELGVSVICPNVRGSTGYGRSYHRLDDGVRREDAIKDIGALLDWIEKQPELDAGRVGIFGGSYGGFVVLASLATFGRRIRAGIDLVGVADIVTFLERTSAYRRDLRRAEYGDERDPAVRAFLERISPLRNADRIESALFVVHGQNDPRAPVNEALQIVSRMRALGRPVWFANALDEGHGFQKKPNRDLASLLYASFWKEKLLP